MDRKRRYQRQLFLLTNYAAAGCALYGYFCSNVASAATATATFSVSATVVKACVISATPLSFGTYDPTTASPVDGTTTVTVTCTNGTSYNVGLNAGTSAGATVTSRKMTQGSNTLNYALYQDAARTTNWGNTVGTDTVSGTASVSPANLTIYGRVAPAQNVPVGTFSDTITATVTY
jgi:spore coat protein U-like protein